MSFASINTALQAILDELVGLGQPFEAKYPRLEPQPGKYPCLMVYANSGKEARLDTANNFLSMQFIIKIVLNSKNTDNAEEQRLTCLDSVLDKLRENVDTLNGACEKLDIVSIQFFETNQAEFPVYGANVIIEASKIKQF